MKVYTAQPVTVKHIQYIANNGSIPFIFGAQDAASGLACVPELHWVQRRDQVSYAAGFESVAGPTLTTRQILGN